MNEFCSTTIDEIIVNSHVLCAIPNFMPALFTCLESCHGNHLSKGVFYHKP